MLVKLRKLTNQITRRLQILINKCLIMNIKWTDKITNEELWRITKYKPTEIQIKRRKWNWIEHTLRKEAGAIEKTALDWNPQGYRRIGRPKNMTKEMMMMIRAPLFLFIYIYNLSVSITLPSLTMLTLCIHASVLLGLVYIC
jgi:hypothetical protein